MPKITVSVSAAQLNGMGATPVTIVPAPGAGKAILPESVTVRYHAGSTGYSQDDQPALYYGDNSSSGSASLTLPFFVNWGTEDSFGAGGLHSLEAFDLAAIANKPLVLDGDLSGGDGSIVVKLTYEVVGVG
jgi:hypothetical protein